MAEAQIVVLHAPGKRSALRKALRIGKRKQLRYRNVFGGTVSITFLGLIDLLDLLPCEPDEVWYRLFDSPDPRKYLTPTQRLSAFSTGPGTPTGSAIWAAPATKGVRPSSKERRPPSR